jgi:hypothetical protein
MADNEYIFFSQTEYFLQVLEFYNRQRIVLANLHTILEKFQWFFY